MATTPTDSDPDLFDLAAKLAGCQPIDLIKVRQDPAGLVVIFVTGQKLVFSLDTIGADVEEAIRAQLAQALGQPVPVPLAPAPAEDLAPAKPKPVRTTKGK